MFRRFLRDRRGNYLMITALVMPVLFGSLTIGVDYAEMSRQCQNTHNAVDAAAFAASRRLLEGAPETTVRTYARDFFDANLTAALPADVALSVALPANQRGGGRVVLDSVLSYKPHFLGAFLGLLGQNEPVLQCRATSAVQLRNTVEVALVLDNSGSMNDNGKGTGEPRIKLLRDAAKQLVDQLAATAALMVQVEKPVQFSVVPFAASVNIGNANASESWMDKDGISPIHHENFDWTTMTGTKKVVKNADGSYKKSGSGWGSQENQKVTRFSLFGELNRTVCNSNGNNCSVVSAGLTWGGCVEARKFPYNTNDETATTSNPETLYQPMFAPDEAGDFNASSSDKDNLVSFSAYNSWWNDLASSSTTTQAAAQARQRYAAKYFTALPKEGSLPGSDKGPNASCTTAAITPLTDVSTAAGKKKIKDGIDAMTAGGATNVPEGLAWGWRTLSSKAPFTGGRPEIERGNDKVIIALTDGANTYYTPSSLNASDTANNKSTYSAYAYARFIPNGPEGRIFGGTSSAVSKSDFTNPTYTAAMNEHFLKVCENTNGGDTGKEGAGIIIMTVALDLNDKLEADKGQMAMLEKCASRSRYARDPKDPTKGRKLYWNATGANLSQVFREIADELSNMRLVM